MGRTWGIGGVLLVVLLACKGASGGSGAPSASGSVAAGAVAAPPEGRLVLPEAPRGILPPGVADGILKRGDPAIVRLIDAGAEPRTPLRYRLQPGAKQNIEFLLDLGVIAGMAGPKIKILYEYATGAPAPSGNWPVTATVKQWSVDGSGPATGLFKTQIAAVLEGLKLEYQLDPRGRVSESKATVPNPGPAGNEVVATLNGAMEAAAAQLPEEPVGVGAQWQYVSRTPPHQPGIDLIHEGVFTLVATGTDHPVYDVTIRQLAASSELAATGAPSLKLESFDSKGTLRVDGDLGAPCPRSGQLALTNLMGLGAASATAPIAATTTVKFTRQ